MIATPIKAKIPYKALSYQIHKIPIAKAASVCKGAKIANIAVSEF